MRKIALVLGMLLVGANIAHACPVLNEDNAIKAIIGEAENQGYAGMFAVACAIRNRGNLRGVFGIHNPRVVNKKYTVGIWLQARKAWRNSGNLFKIDPTKGATNWENTSDFGRPDWADSMIETVTIKDHVFFKPKKKGK